MGELQRGLEEKLASLEEETQSRLDESRAALSKVIMSLCKLSHGVS